MDGEREPVETPPADAPATTGTPPEPAAPVASAAPAPPAPVAPVDTSTPWRFWLKVAALLFFVGYAVAFIVGNNRSISVDFVFASAHVSLIWSVLLLLMVGLAAGLLGSHLYRQRRSKQTRKP